jgi:serine/threonine protein phosphatase 1
MVKTYCIGDVHGRYEALRQLLTETPFNLDTDRLITLGDLVDGGRKTRQCIDLLLTVLNRIDIRGNHDYPWFYDWITKGIEVPVWTHQGGLATMESYDFDWKSVPRAHKKLIENMLPYFVDEKNNLYVHGGFNPRAPIENQKPEFLTWDRTLIKYARSHIIKKYNHVFVGHTTTQMIDRAVTTPITMHNLTMMDCGGGYIGRLALMDVDTHEYWVSDTQVPYYEPGSVDDDGADDTEEEMAWGGRMA